MSKRSREISYKGFTIIQTVEYKENPVDGAGNEVKTTIKELPKHSGFDQMIWLNKNQQKERVLKQLENAKYAIDVAMKAKEPDLFEEMGFKEELKSKPLDYKSNVAFKEEPESKPLDYFERQNLIDEQRQMDGDNSIYGNPSY